MKKHYLFIDESGGKGYADTIILLSRDRNDEVILCPLAVFVLVPQLLKRNLETFSSMSQRRLVIFDFRICSSPKPLQITWRASELIIKGFERKRREKTLKLLKVIILIGAHQKVSVDPGFSSSNVEANFDVGEEKLAFLEPP